jgi:hypothetical protein
VSPEDFLLWNRSHDEGVDLLGPERYPKLDALYDMAAKELWEQV